MRHAESTHQSRYLVGVTMEHKLESMARQLQQDEGQAKKETPTVEVMKIEKKLPEDVEAKLARLEEVEAKLAKFEALLKA